MTTALFPSNRNNVTAGAGLTAEFVYVTPEIAEELLELNTGNRRANPERIKKLVKQLQEGSWDDNGASIVISRDGKLVDGQHRLYAIMEAGIPQWLLIVTGADRDTILTVDSGKTRTFKDYLEIQHPDKKDHQAIASAVHLISRWEAGVRGAGLFNSVHNHRTDNHALAAFYEKNMERVDYVVSRSNAFSRKVGLWKGSKRAIVIAVHVLERINYPDADDFFTKMTTGVGLKSGDAILALINGAANLKRTEKRDAEAWLAYIFKTWNHYRAGKTVSSIRWSAGGAIPEPFPTPR